MTRNLPLRIFGIDPGLTHCGWGVIETEGNRLAYIASGAVTTHSRDALAERLAAIFDGLVARIAEFAPAEAAIENTFVNANPASALRLGFARGVAMLAPAKAGLQVAEYPANLVKKSVSGYGHADKAQIQAMVGILLPGSRFDSPDAADALAIAICHAHHRRDLPIR